MSGERIFGGAKQGRPFWRAIRRGAARRCPQCGEGRLFEGYTKTRDACPACGLDFSGHRADDAPPYVTIMIVGHALIPLALAAKQLFDPPLWLQFALWGPAIITATFALLPAAKGGIIGLQWSHRMHGFSESEHPEDERAV